MVEGVSLYGGYSLDFSARDPEAYETILEDESAQGGGDDHNRVVYVPPDITASTIIDGFTFWGGGGDVSTAIWVINSSPTISNNDIDGGWGNTSVGIRFENASSHIVGNWIYGGSGGNKSRGISVINCPPSLLIQENNIEGGEGLNDTIGINVKGASSPTIKANWIEGGNGNISRGIFSHEGSAPTIQGNSIYGGVGVSSLGIDNLGTSPLIEENYIHGGDGNGTIGIYCRDNAYPKINANTIYGGTSTAVGSATGIYIINESLFSDEIIIRNNVIDGGLTGPTPASSAGIRIFYFDRVIIQNNTINGGIANAGDSYGIYLESGATLSRPIIENNIIFVTGGVGSPRYCVFEADSDSDPWYVFNNDFWDKPNTIDTVYYWDENTTGVSWINFGVMSVSTVLFTNFLPNWSNLEDDPQFKSDDDLRLTPGGGLNLLVRTLGFDLSAEFTTDRDGNQRTVPWSMGAYEEDN
jgi:hypothetical protein